MISYPNSTGAMAKDLSPTTARPLLSAPPTGDRARELWLQHAAGFVLFRDIRAYAMGRLDPNLDKRTREVAVRAIDDALYGLMMVADGVTGALRNGAEAVELSLVATFHDREGCVAQLNLCEGDGMCMGFHGWMNGDFGANPPFEAE